MNLLENKKDAEQKKKSRKGSGLEGLILAGVFLLGVVLPSKYKAFAPLLFLIPLIAAGVRKIRKASEEPAIPSHEQSWSPPLPDRPPSREPYSCKPKDPKDPRRYKPIG